MIETNIATGGVEQTRGFGWIEDYEVTRRTKNGKGVLKASVTVAEWLYKAFLHYEVLTIDRRYLSADAIARTAPVRVGAEARRRQGDLEMRHRDPASEKWLGPNAQAFPIRRARHHQTRFPAGLPRRVGHQRETASDRVLHTRR